MAKEVIYTIPVIDAFKEDCECPLCKLYEKLEKDSVDFVLSPSYMDVDVRGYTNEFGFCRTHFTKLYAEKNRLGVALILESHMKKIREDLKKNIKKNIKSPTLFKNKKNASNGLSQYANNLLSSCYICNRVNDVFNRYIDTFFYLWKKDEAFRTSFKESKGLCISHFATLYDTGQQLLNVKAFDEFSTILVKLQEDNYDRVIQDIEWFITKFDYRYEKESWKNSKDSIVRSIQKIASFNVSEQIK